MARFSIERYLNIRSAYRPSFSPDGRRLAFISNITGIPQVWQVSPQGGWPEQLTFFAERVSGAVYSPTENKIIFGMDYGGNERQQLWLITDHGKEVTCLTNHPDSIHRFGGWNSSGSKIAFASNRRNPAVFDIYIQELTSSKAQMVYQGNGSLSIAAWSHDDRFLVISQAYGSMNNDLFLLDLETRETQLLTDHHGDAIFSRVTWCPNSNGFYLITDLDREFRALAYYDCETRQLEFVRTPNWDVEDLAIAPDGRLLAYTVNVEGYSKLHIIDLSDNSELNLSDLPYGVISSMTWSPNEHVLAFTLSGARHNPNVWVYNVATQQATQVTKASTAGIPAQSFREPKLIHYRTFDRREIPAFFYLPANVHRDGSLPVIVYVHGGPESQARPSFNGVIQYFLHRGYAVLATNVRGSTGYGKAYSHLDDVDKRMDSVADLKYAVEWLKKSGYAHPEKIAVMGGSYGGFMVLAALTTYPELWAAGVDIVGIANFVTFLNNTGPWRRKLREAEYGNPEKDRPLLENISPINHVKNIKAPLMVIHGANDPRVPISEAEQIVASIRRREGIVEYLRFDDEGHGIIKLPNRITAYRAIADFLDRYVK